MGDIVDLHARGPGSRFPVALGSTVRNNRVEHAEYTWTTFKPRFRHPVITEESVDDYLKMTVDQQGAIKDVGYFVPGKFLHSVRKKSHLEKRFLGCLDIDHAGPEWTEALQTAYGHCAYLLHSTHKHTPEHPRLRMIFPLSRAVNEIEYGAIMRRAASWWELNVFDHTGFEFARVMHFPSRPADGKYIFEDHPGAFLDVDALLDTYLDPADMSEWPTTDKERGGLHNVVKKAENPLEKPGYIGAFCNCYRIEDAMEAFIPDAYVPGSTPDRFTYALGSGSNGAVVYDDGLFLYSNHESDPVSGKNVNAWDLVRMHRFGHLDTGEAADTPGNVQKLKSFAAMMALAKEDRKTANYFKHEQHHLIKEELRSFDDLNAGEETTDDDDGLGETPITEAKDEDDGLGTPDPLAAPIVKEAKKNWVFQTDKNGEVVKCLHNVICFLEKSKALRGCLAHNLFSGEVLQMRRLPGQADNLPRKGVAWSDLAELLIKEYLNTHHDICFSSVLIHEACLWVAHQHWVDPPRTWMRGLVWDGVNRLDTVFVDFLGVEDTPYTRAVTRKWFCQGVDRLLHPGCQADHMLVFEGPEGSLKSAMARALSKGWFVDDLSLGLESKEIVERTRGAWVVEVQEMITGRNATNEHVKAFISRRAETVRLSYERNAGGFPRSFILLGTTNEGDYLRGASGNRRVWPLKGDGRAVDLLRLETVVDQLWAEAKYLHEVLREPTYLEDAELRVAAQAMQSSRVEYDEWTGMFEAWLSEPISEHHWQHYPREAEDFEQGKLVPRDRTCVMELWVECLHKEVGDLTQREGRRIGTVLRHLGWVPADAVRFGVRYGRTRGYYRTPS